MKRKAKLAAVGLVAWAACMHVPESLAAATVYTSKAAFLSVTGQRIGANFEDAPTQQLGPFSSGGILFPTNSMQVTSSLVVSHSFFFGSEGSPPNFAVVSGPTWDVRATFQAEVRGSGFDLNCFGCDILPNDSALDWSTYGQQGTLIQSGTIIVDFSGPTSVKFFGLTSDRPFRTLHVRRRGVSQAVFSTWVVDDVRIVPFADTTVQVPTLGSAATVATIVFLLVLGALTYRRVA